MVINRESNQHTTNTAKYCPPSSRSRYKKNYSNKPSDSNKSSDSNKQTNMFKNKNNYLKNNKVEFSLQSVNFPELNKPTKPTEPTEPQNYLEKIQKKKEEELEKKLLVPLGWRILDRNIRNRDNVIKNDNTTEWNKTYAPWRSKLIMDNRLNQRLELNEILGDISPYWNYDLYGIESDNDEYIDNIYEDEDDDDYESAHMY